MTPSKTPKMKEINKEIRKLNPNAKALTYYDFINTEAKELLLEFNDNKSKLNQKELLHKIANIPISRIDVSFPTTDSENVANFNNTALFFGLDSSLEKLIHSLSSNIYTTIIIKDKESKEDIGQPYGLVYRELEPKVKFEQWIELCKRLDMFKKHFNSLNKENQDELRKGIQLIKNAEFIENDNIVNHIAIFLSNHKLSQLTKYKINKLLEINLPNLQTEELAKDIIKFSKFLH